MRFLKWIIAAIIVLAAIVAGAYTVVHRPVPAAVRATPEEAANIYVRFDMEAYDTIRANYWASTTEAQMADLFQLSAQKAIGSPVVPMLLTRDRAGTAQMLSAVLANATSTDAERQIALGTLQVALYNLTPVGHDQLLSQKQETAFRENVSNVDPGKDLYGQLGLAAGASADAVKQAYAAKQTQLAIASASATSTEAKAAAKTALVQASYAEKVLANPNTKDLYDAAKIEPTLWSRTIGKTLYINLTKVSPTSLIEFGRTVLSASTTPGLDSMVIDLRGNLGGALDFATAFLGLFLGPNQYAYDLFHQGTYEPQRTTTAYFPELARYRDIAVLTDGMTQSTAEATAAALRRFKLATLVGERTRGWGTVENTFPLSTSIDPSQAYTMLLVHSLTLGVDNQPIQDNGVAPDVDIKDPNWKAELSSHFSSSSLIAALKQIAAERPLQ